MYTHSLTPLSCTTRGLHPLTLHRAIQSCSLYRQTLLRCEASLLNQPHTRIAMLLPSFSWAAPIVYTIPYVRATSEQQLLQVSAHLLEIGQLLLVVPRHHRLLQRLQGPDQPLVALVQLGVELVLVSQWERVQQSAQLIQTALGDRVGRRSSNASVIVRRASMRLPTVGMPLLYQSMIEARVPLPQQSEPPPTSLRPLSSNCAARERR